MTVTAATIRRGFLTAGSSRVTVMLMGTYWWLSSLLARPIVRELDALTSTPCPPGLHAIATLLVARLSLPHC